MNIYVLSLPDDIKRREMLSVFFVNKVSKFIFFDAFDKNYAENIIAQGINVKKTSFKIGLSEVACSLGHIAILEKVIESKSNFSLILEDDIIGNDDDLNKIEKISKFLPKESILIAGGIDGLKSSENLYGICINKELKLYKIPKIYYRYIARTCCYLVSPTIALQIIDKQRVSLDRADNWAWLLEKSDNVYYSPILRHPLTLENSHIEVERNQEMGTNFFYKIFKEGFLLSFYYFFRKKITKIWAKYKVYEKLLK